jgi:MFS family permease
VSGAADGPVTASALDDTDPDDGEVKAPGSVEGVAVVAGRAWALLLSVGLLMAGAGLQGSLLGLRAGVEGFSATVTGAVLGSYYLGYVVGSAWVPTIIRSVGHVRAFAGLASLLSVTSVIHAVWLVPIPWLLLRFAAGICLAGIFVVAESWLSAVATPATRATLLGLYMTVVTAGLVAGQFLLAVAAVDGFVLFVVASTILSLAVVPVAFAPLEPPPLHDRISYSIRRLWHDAPLALVGSGVSGFGGGTALGFGAVYATAAGFGIAGASQVVAAVLIGGSLGQMPLGRLSDRVDRRYVIALAAALTAGSAAVVVAATSMGGFTLVVVGAFGVGAGVFPLYSLSLAHVADYLEPMEFVAAGARMILVNGLGAALGPVTAAIVIESRGPRGMFEVMVVVFALLAVYALYRPLRRRPRSLRSRWEYPKSWAWSLSPSNPPIVGGPVNGAAAAGAGRVADREKRNLDSTARPPEVVRSPTVGPFRIVKGLFRAHRSPMVGRYCRSCAAGGGDTDRQCSRGIDARGRRIRRGVAPCRIRPRPTA